jgi:hypothetical protein
LTFALTASAVNGTDKGKGQGQASIEWCQTSEVIRAEVLAVHKLILPPFIIMLQM